MVAVPIEVEVEVPAGASLTEGGEQGLGPGLTTTTQLGTCCDVEGMDGATGIRNALLLDMARVVSFARDTYGLGHQGPITLHISHSASGLLVRCREAIGERLDELPDECSFQEGEHMFFTPACRSDRRALAKEFFTRALNPDAVSLPWVGTGTMDYVVSHYVTGDTPELTEDRYRRAIFNDRGRDLRLGEASEGLMGAAVAYAIHEYGSSRSGFRSTAGSLAGQQPAGAFEAPLDHFYADFEEWAADQRLILIVTGFGRATRQRAPSALRGQGGCDHDERFPALPRPAGRGPRPRRPRVRGLRDHRPVSPNPPICSGLPQRTRGAREGPSRVVLGRSDALSGGGERRYNRRG